MLIGLIASTGMILSEALGLKFTDIKSDGILHIRETKFGKKFLLKAMTMTIYLLE